MASKYVDPCRLQLGTHQREETGDDLLQLQSEPIGQPTRAYSLKCRINMCRLGGSRNEICLPLTLAFFPGGPVTEGVKICVCRV